MVISRRFGALATALLLATALSACSTVGDDSLTANDQPNNVAPVNDAAVSSDPLPPIGGADGSVQVASNGDTATAPAEPPLLGDAPGQNTTAGATPAAPGADATPPGTFVSLNDAAKPSSGAGRDLSGALTVEKLLGGWTVTAGTSQCRLNLTYSATADASRYRASAPGCVIATLGAVSAWQLSGTQVQLFDDSNQLVGALLLSGNRFIGTLTGGQAISMVG